MCSRLQGDFMNTENKVTLSVFVITKNEETKIVRCLSHLSFADELLVLDSESTDATVSLAKKFTKKIFTRKFEGYGPQKQAAIDKCSNTWILEIDADEIVTPELAKEIMQLLSYPKKLEQHAAYAVVRQEFFMGKPLMKSLIPRLYRKDLVSYHEPIHEKLSIRGSIGRLSGILLHESDRYETSADRIQKNNVYTTIEAQRLFATNHSSSLFSLFSFVSVLMRMIFVPCFYFLWLYFGKSLVFRGKRGLIWCFLTAHYHFLIYAKLYEYIYKQKHASFV